MDMIRRIRFKILCCLYAIKAGIYRIKGVEIGKKSFISGFPYLRTCKGGRIIMGNNVTVHSKKKYNTLITDPVTLSVIEPGGVIELHDHCGISGCKIVCACHISIGRYTIVGPDTVIYDCKPHKYQQERGWSGLHTGGGAPIKIGERCYIGMRCIILKGVTIGNDCVISAGTVITKDVPDGHIAQGNPAVYSPLPARLTSLEG